MSSASFQNTIPPACCRIKCCLLTSLGGILAVFGVIPGITAESESTVAKEKEISDFQARREMAKSLAENESTVEQALKVYQKLLELKPARVAMAIEAAEIARRTGQREKALKWTDQAESHIENAPTKRLKLARFYASLGHHPAAMRALNTAFGNGLSKKEHVQAVGSVFEMCGFFYRAEKLYQDYLAEHDDAWAIRLKLAALFRSSDRYAEAEGIYREIIAQNDSPAAEIFFGLAQLYYEQKHLDKAVSFAEKVLQQESGHHEAKLLKAKALIENGELRDAMRIYENLAQLNTMDVRIEALLGRARIYRKNDKRKEARALYTKAEELRKVPRTRFWVTAPEDRTDKRFLDQVQEWCQDDPEAFVKWGKLFRNDDRIEQATFCFREALKREPRYTPARLHLVQTLAAEHEYEAALTALDEIDEALSSSRKIVMLKARIHSWARHYTQAFSIYETLHARNAGDPIPLLESARVASWTEEIQRSLKFYDKLLSPPVDRELLGALKPLRDEVEATAFREAYDSLKEKSENADPCDGYKAFREQVDAVVADVSEDRSTEIQEHLRGLRPQYVLQRKVYLEREAKRHSYHQHHLRARSALKDLVTVAPDNQEARFMLGQAQCSLGLCGAAKRTYERLLDISGGHNLAKMALKDSRIKHHPAVFFRGKYWQENGRGELSGIDLYKTSLGVDIPVFCRMHLRFAGHRWYERGDFDTAKAEANGTSVAFRGKLNAWLRFKLAYTRKDYEEAEYDDENLGSAEIWANVYDYARFGIGFERSAELYNTIGMRQGVTSDTSWFGVKAQPTRRVSFNAKFRDKSYSDNNEGAYHHMELGYRFMRHPRELKLIARGEYRHTAEESVLQYGPGGRLQDIVHPYWTPEGYTAWDLILAWRHDLSRRFFCGNNQHFYGVRVGVGNDSENNPGATVEGTWHYEWNNHWTIEVNGYLHNSQDWDASGIWLRTTYRF